MTAIDTKIPPIDIRRELYGSFIQPTWKKQQSQKDYLDKYTENVTNPHSNAFRFTVAGAVILLLGGGGAIFGRNKLPKIIANLNKSVKEQINNNSIINKTKEKLVDGLNIYYSGDKYKDFGIMKGLLAIDKGLNKIKLGFLKPGKWIFDFSRLSLKLTGGNWFGLGRQYKDAEGRIETALKDLASTKKPINHDSLSGTKEILEDLKDSLGAVIGGKNKRLEKLEELVVTKNISNFNEKYCPRSGESFGKNFKRIKGEWDKVFESKDPKRFDVLRENWETTTGPIVEEELMNTKGTSGKTFKACLGALDEKLKTLEESAKEQDAKSPFSKYVKDLKNLRNKIEDAIKYETDGRGDGYAGRAVDLHGGGGIQETVITVALAGIIGTSTVKNSKKGDTPADIGKRFVKTGGLEFLGGLGAMFYIQFIKGISGAKGLVVGGATALGMNLAKKIYMKATGQVSEKEEKKAGFAKLL
jgi:hypothetical protein